MDAELRKQRRLAATKARRNIFTETEHPKSYFELMSEAEREAFFARERKRSATALKQRKIRKTIITAVGLAIAITISILISMRSRAFVPSAVIRALLRARTAHLRFVPASRQSSRNATRAAGLAITHRLR